MPSLWLIANTTDNLHPPDSMCFDLQLLIRVGSSTRLGHRNSWIACQSWSKARFIQQFDHSTFAHSSFVIPIAPLAEQKRIADKLEAVLGRVNACRVRLDRVPALLKRFRQSVLAAATSGKLTEEWRMTNGAKAGAAHREIVELIKSRQKNSGSVKKFKEPLIANMSQWSTVVPVSWSVESVSAFAECLDSARVPVKRDKRANAKGLYPYYGANGEVDRVDGFLFDDELVLVTEDETFYGREKPIAYRSSGKCWVNNHAHVLRASDVVSSNYLCYALMYYEIIPWLTGTTGRAKLTQGVLNALPIAVPPKEEMNEIVRRVEDLFAFADRIEARLTVAQKTVDRLTPSVLAKAFRGELVPQDPSDEPASLLLERLTSQPTAKPARATRKSRK
jgi:type I restriction enzyme S subunit